jgi:hypothetical protein
MINGHQREALRAFVLAALNRGLVAADELEIGSIQWAPRDHPRGPSPWCSLQIIADEEQGLEPEVLHDSIPNPTPPPANVLRETIRQEHHVTLSVTLRILRDDAAPSWLQDAAARLRRLTLQRYSDAISVPLDEAGCPILRCGPVRDLTLLRRGSQFETTASVDLVLRCMWMVREGDEDYPGWIETTAGEGTLSAPGDPSDPLALPFDTSE